MGYSKTVAVFGPNPERREGGLVDLGALHGVVPLRILAMVPSEVARDIPAVPLATQDVATGTGRFDVHEVLVCIGIDAATAEALRDIQRRTGRAVTVLVAERGEVQALAARLYPR